MEQRLIDLEVRYAHLERLVEDLNGVVYAQQQTIERLVRQVADLASRVTDPGGAPAAEKPPHY